MSKKTATIDVIDGLAALRDAYEGMKLMMEAGDVLDPGKTSTLLGIVNDQFAALIEEIKASEK